MRNQLLKFPLPTQSSRKSSHLKPRKRKLQRLKKKKSHHHPFPNLPCQKSLWPKQNRWKNLLAAQSKYLRTRLPTLRISKRKSTTLTILKRTLKKHMTKLLNRRPTFKTKKTRLLKMLKRRSVQLPSKH